jgi:hypothetical protein
MKKRLLPFSTCSEEEQKAHSHRDKGKTVEKPNIRDTKKGKK